MQTPEYTGSGAVSGQNKHFWFALYRRKLQITGQLIIGAGGHLIQFRNVTFRENLLRCSEAVHPVAADAGNLIGNPSCQIQFMKGHDDRQFSCPGHILYNGKKFQLIADVQKRSRFIQDDDIRLLAKCSGEHNPLFLSVTGFRKIPLRQFFNMNQPHGFVYDLPVFLRKDAKFSRIGIPSRRHHISAVHHLRPNPLCQYHRQLLRKLSAA